MTRPKVVLLICFLVAFAAGGATGLVTGRRHHRPRRRSWLADRLGLTPEQREQMRDIWSDFMNSDTRQKHRELREALRRERDEAIQALLSDDQRGRYEQVMENYRKKSEELSEERRKLSDERRKLFEERTKKILTEPQRLKYEEFLKERGGRRSVGRRGRRGRGAPDGEKAPAGKE